MGSGRIRVMCVDDHRLVREGVAALLNQQPDMEVVARAANGEDANARCESLPSTGVDLWSCVCP